MKIKFTIVPVIAAALLMASCTINKPKDETRKITVSGSSTVFVDQTSLTFTVKNAEMDQNTASEKNATIVSNIQKTLTAEGIESKDISVTGAENSQENVTVQWYKNENGEWKNEATQYTVTNSVKVLVRDVTKTKALKDTVLSKNKENTVLASVQYISGDMNACLRQSRTLAIQNAQDGANLLAGASGNKTDSVLEIVEGDIITKNINPKTVVQETLPGTQTAATEGTSTVTANVRVTYTLIN